MVALSVIFVVTRILLSALGCLLLASDPARSFTPMIRCIRNQHYDIMGSCRSSDIVSRNVRKRSSSLHMVFDFLRKRSEEGLAQVQNIASKSLQGKLGEALSESADYVQQRRRIDAENLKRLTAGLSRSREQLLQGISGVFSSAADMSVENRLEELETVLLQADIGATTSGIIIDDLRRYARAQGLKEEAIMPVLRARLVESLQSADTAPRNNNNNSSSSGLLFSPDPQQPSVIFVIGANGMGKTTTIGKIAARLQREENASVLLGACDTFRAAAVEQLGEWAMRANVSIEKPTAEEQGGDPVPVVTRTMQRAKRDGFDVVIIDTSGRLSNNFELVQQLQDMKKAIQQEDPLAPHETLLVVDGSVGRNAVQQAAAWRKHVGVTGLAITKLDGTARGGFVVSVVRDLGLPVKFIGVGEKIDDLRDFQAEVFVDALLGNNEAQSKDLKKRANKIFQITEAAATTAVTGTTSSTAAANDPAARLRASFDSSSSSSSGSGSSSDSSGVVATSADAVGVKPKRPKRVKPQSKKPKKQK